MRALAGRLGVVPGALYRHVRSKKQLYDLILDAVLAGVDLHVDPATPWTAQAATLARRLRTVLENHPGIAALLKTRDPVSPTSLALAEAFLAPLHAFLRALPASRFPILAAHGIHAWADDREERFTSGLGTLLRGLQAAEVPRRPPSPVVPAGDRVSSLGF
jgi:AcrR family transcriptional regulator